jgi:hypothetical protein
MTQTLEQIRREGLEALRERLGRIGMIRFLQQFETGSGDYASERHAWVDQASMEELTTPAPRSTTRAKSKRGKRTSRRR